MKTAEEIYNQMMDRFAEESGVSMRESCDLAVRFYTVAAQIEGLYHQLDWVRGQCFPQTATGESLDHHAQLRGLTRKAATQAGGTLRFFAGEGQTTDRTVPEGTVAMTAGLLRFVTTEAVTIVAGDGYADAPAVAEVAGGMGNVPALAVVSMATAPVGVVQCSNLAPFVGGMDAEGDEALRDRVMDGYRRLPNGVNVAYYEQEALAYDGVVSAVVCPCVRGVGTVDIVVASEGGMPDAALLSSLGDYFDVRREIAVSTLVRAPEGVSVDVNVAVKAAVGHSQTEANEAVERALAGWFGGEGLGRAVLVAELASMIFACPEVANCKLIAPASDVAVDVDELPTLGTVTTGVLA